jgi:GntR family transcriptional regulator, transcriptional repressor for pyruvate dehydrogenase complex
MSITGLTSSLTLDSPLLVREHEAAERPRNGAVETAIQHIRELIRSGNPRTGARLPSERDLAKICGVGRPAVREAVKALSIMGLLETRRGSGSYVTAQTAAAADWPARIILDDSNLPLLHLWEVRQMFEPKAAALAASRATDGQLRRMESHLAAQQASLTLEVIEREDLLFHAAIIDASGNPVLRHLATGVQAIQKLSLRRTARTTPDLQRVVDQHRRIFDCIRLGQPELAETAMAEHLRTAGLDIVSEAAR